MTHTDFKQTKHLPYLDGIRAVAILMVLFHHVHLRYYPTSFDWGFWGVQIFFCLSGFLITTLLIREKEATGTISLRKFYMRRTLRIFPVYYLVIGVYCLLVWKFETGQYAKEFWANLPYFLTYTYNWVIPKEHGRVIFFLAWSLAVEEQFYLIWPLAIKHAWWIWFGLLFFSPSMALGCALAWVMNHKRGYEIVSMVRLPKLLDNPSIVHIGIVSYGMYLTHGLTMRIVEKLLPQSSIGVFYLAVVAASIGVAWVLYQLYEQPFLNLKRRFQWTSQRQVKSQTTPNRMTIPLSRLS